LARAGGRCNRPPSRLWHLSCGRRFSGGTMSGIELPRIGCGVPARIDCIHACAFFELAVEYCNPHEWHFGEDCSIRHRPGASLPAALVAAISHEHQEPAGTRRKKQTGAPLDDPDRQADISQEEQRYLFPFLARCSGTSRSTRKSTKVRTFADKCLRLG
jgi:hypothetical protein